MEPVDITGPTFGFKAPADATERRRLLRRMRWSAKLRRQWPLLRIIVGLVLFIGILFSQGVPTIGNLVLACGMSLLWFAVTWAYAGRYRLAPFDAPEALAKKGLKGNVLSRMVAIEARTLLEQAVLLAGVPSDLELTSPPQDGEIPGLKVSFATLGQLMQEVLPLPMPTIASEVVETGTDTFDIRFTLQREGRKLVDSAIKADNIREAGPRAAKTLIRLAAPFHGAICEYFTDHLEDAWHIAREAATDPRVPVKIRAYCWCLLAIILFELGDKRRCLLALHQAEAADDRCVITPALVASLLRTELGDDFTVDERTAFAEVRDWYLSLAKAAGYSSYLLSKFELATTTAAYRQGREVSLRGYEKRLRDLIARLDKVVKDQMPLGIALNEYTGAIRQVTELQKKLLGNMRPEADDTAAFVELHGQMLKEIAEALERTAAASNDKLERWKSEAELLKSEFEQLKETYPERYRKSMEFRGAVEEQAAQVEQIKDVIEQTTNYLKSEQQNMTRRSEEQKKWRELLEADFGELASPAPQPSRKQPPPKQLSPKMPSLSGE
jgi:hypothetical protein